jgi:preprotein translocase subunit SecD
MNEYPTWRYVLIIAMVVLGFLYALPNIYGDDYAIQLTSRNSAGIPSGFVTQLKAAMTKQQVGFTSVVSAAPKSQSILIRFSDAAEQTKAKDLLEALYKKNYAVALNLAPRTPKWLQAIGANPMRLGLDLRGGVHFLLEVDTAKMLKDRFTQDVHSFGSKLQSESIRYSGITPKQGKMIIIDFSNQTSLNQALKLLQKNYPTYTFTTNTQPGNLQIEAMMQPQALKQLKQYAMQQNITILRKKVNMLGVSEPTIQQQGQNQISVSLPGIQDTARAKNIIGKMATVRLQLADGNVGSTKAQQAASTGIIPLGDTLYYYQGQPLLLKNEVVLSGSAITNASSGVDRNGQPSVNVTTSGPEVPNFQAITGKNINKGLAIVYVETKTDKKLVNGKVKVRSYQQSKVISVASINQALAYSFQISGGDMTTAYTKDLAFSLRSGSYVAPVHYAMSSLVGPSLGKENIRHGVLSCAVGSLFVILFMAFYYRGFGLIANIALILNVVFVVAVMSILGATMTLPGIAGIVLTVGMAVDANVLINERIREELRLGMTPQAAIKAGYERAFATIVDANVTTLIVAMILFALGSGSVQGFAVTLSIGLVTSMITAIFFTRAIVNKVYGNRKNLRHLSIGIKAQGAK